jgi:hypothetical protein
MIDILGLLAMVGVDISDCFQHLVDRVCAIIIGMKGKFSLWGENKFFER